MMSEAFTTLHFSVTHDNARKAGNSVPSSPKSRRQNLQKSNSSANVLSVPYKNNNNDGFKRGNSFVVGQKLRESKWFEHSETAIFCAVVETGFIIELEKGEQNYFGIAVWNEGCEKSKNPEYLKIYTLEDNGKSRPKVLNYSLMEFWPKEGGPKIRINNKCDRTDTPLTERVIRQQILFALNARRKWHNSEHFTYFCRYGPVEHSYGAKKITDQLKWSTESFFSKIKSLSIR